jgi:septal ring factor EnvC (AmiA/AmiB activator)
MTETPSFLRRKQPPPEHLPATPGYSRKSAEAFLDDFAETKKENAILKRALDDAAIENEKLQSQLAWQRIEMERVARGREEFRKAAHELQVQLEVIVTTSVSSGDQCKAAVDAVVNQARASLDRVREEMAKAGVSNMDTSLPPADVETLKIADHFGANNRRVEDQ